MVHNNSDSEGFPVLKEKTTLYIKDTKIDGRPSAILIDDTGSIAALGEDAKQRKSEAEYVIDGSSTLAIPGLVNMHTHAAMTLLRGYADDMHLQEWLTEKIWPMEAHLLPKDIYWGTKLACLEMIRTGTIAFNDMYFYSDMAVQAVDEAGVKAVLSHAIITFGDEDKMEKEIKGTESLVSVVRSKNNSRIQASVAPHAPYTVPPKHLEWCAEYSREHDLMLHIHLSETEHEVLEVLEKYQKSPTQLLDETGCLHENTVLAHCCWLNKDECRLIGESGSHVAHNPVSNMKLATNRAMPYHWLKGAGVNVGLATDGCSSNNSLDMLEEMKAATLLQKFFWNQDTLLPADEALHMATAAGAKALRCGTGKIEKGAPADIVLISLNHPSMIPMHNPLSNIVYAANGGMVKTVLCNGRILMKDTIIPGEDNVLEMARKSVDGLLSRAAENGIDS